MISVQFVVTSIFAVGGLSALKGVWLRSGLGFNYLWLTFWCNEKQKEKVTI